MDSNHGVWGAPARTGLPECPPVASFCFCANRLRSGPSEKDTDRTEWQGLRSSTRGSKSPAAVCAQGLALGQAHRPGFHAPEQAPKGRTHVCHVACSALET